MEHRDLGTWCDAVTDQQTETAPAAGALHPPVVVTAQPDQPR